MCAAAIATQVQGSKSTLNHRVSTGPATRVELESICMCSVAHHIALSADPPDAMSWQFDTAAAHVSSTRMIYHRLTAAMNETMEHGPLSVNRSWACLPRAPH